MEVNPGAVEKPPRSHGQAHPGAMKAHPEDMDGHPKTMEAHLGAMEAHSGAEESHPGAVEARPGGIAAYLQDRRPPSSKYSPSSHGAILKQLRLTF
jgi:hypothetical protein